MAEAALYLSNWQTLAAAVVEQSVVDLMDHHSTIRTDAVEFIQANDFKDYLIMAGVCHTAAACRLSLRRRGILPDLPGPTSRPGRAARACPEACRVFTVSLTREEESAPSPDHHHEAEVMGPQSEEPPEAIPETPPPLAELSGPGVEKLHGIEIIRI